VKKAGVNACEKQTSAVQDRLEACGLQEWHWKMHMQGLNTRKITWPHQNATEHVSD